MIKLKDILLNEETPTDVKSAFGRLAFGSVRGISALQGKKGTEKNTQFETEMLSILRSWVASSQPWIADKLIAKYDILKNAAEVFPTVLKPATPNGTELYRGLRRLNDSLMSSLADADESDFEQVIYNGFQFYKYKIPIKYIPRSEVQSWTSDIEIPKKFADSGVLMTTQNEEYLFSQKAMYILFKQADESETLHFGKKYANDVYIMIKKDVYERILVNRKLKKIGIAKTKEEVQTLVDIFDIRAPKINDDLTVDVLGAVYIYDTYFVGSDVIPIKFGKVTGNFIATRTTKLKSLQNFPREIGGDLRIDFNSLETLEGGPIKVDGSYSVRHNKLRTLEGAPEEVGGDFDCGDNNLTSLKGGPNKVGGEYDCEANELISLEGAPSELLGGAFRCSGNKLTSLEGAPKSIGGYADFSFNEPLTSLKGLPSHIGSTLFLRNTPNLPQSEIDTAKQKGITDIIN